MVKIINKYGEVKKGKLGRAVYQGKYGIQIRRVREGKRRPPSKKQQEQRERYLQSIAWWKSLSTDDKQHLKNIIEKYHIRSPEGLPHTAYTYAKRIGITGPKWTKREGPKQYPSPYENYKYRLPITIINHESTELTDYPIRIELTSGNFNFQHVKDDGADIRFTREDGISSLAYTILHFDKINQKAVIYVNITNMPANGTVKIYMYYGNPEATPGENPTNTFHLFDDIEGNVGDIPNNWVVNSPAYGTVEVTTDYKRHGDKGYWYRDTSPDGYPLPSREITRPGSKYFVLFACLDNETAYSVGTYISENVSTIGWNVYHRQDQTIQYYDNNWKLLANFTLGEWTWILMEIDEVAKLANLYAYDKNWNLIGSATGVTPRSKNQFTTATHISQWGSTAAVGENFWYDCWAIGKWTTNPPTYSIGVEELPEATLEVNIRHPALKTIEWIDESGTHEQTNLSSLTAETITTEYKITAKDIESIKITTLADIIYNITV